MIGNQTKWRKEALSLIQDAGFYELTPFQKRVVPLILKGRDTIFEYSIQRGKTVAFILPLLMRIEPDAKGIKAIVLAAGTREVAGIFREFGRFQSPQGRSRRRNPAGSVSLMGSADLTAALLSEEQDIRSEVRSVSRKPDIVISTPGRLIDHIRRENTEFAGQVRLIICGENADSGFHKDLQFIYSKLPSVKQSIVFSPVLDPGGSQQWSILRRPRIVRETEFTKSLRKARHLFYIAEDGHRKEALHNLIVSKNLGPLLIYCENGARAAEVKSFLEGRGLAGVSSVNGGGGDAVDGGGGYLIGTESSMESKIVTGVRDIVNFDPPRDSEHYLNRCAPLAADVGVIHTLRSRDQDLSLNHIQETLKVTVKNQGELSEDDAVKGTIQKILKIIKEKEDPDELNRYRRLVKRNVPIFLRSYFMAYLFKESLGKIERKPDAFTTLFISIGKNRRVYPRDLINLFTKNLRLKRSEIGEIKVLDNYSFMDISLDHASEAITKLSGVNFRGRRITVNRARKKDNSKD